MSHSRDIQRKHTPEPLLIDAATATSRLGVNHATLYAYVSRGLVRSTPDPANPRAHLYAAADVSALVQKKSRRRPTIAAATALDWGLPVLQTRLSRIEGGRLSYRGRDAVTLAETATLEDIARLFWDTGWGAGTDASLDGPLNIPFGGITFDPSFDPSSVPGWSRTAADVRTGSATDRGLALLPLLLLAGDPPALGQLDVGLDVGLDGHAITPPVITSPVIVGAARLVQALATAVAGTALAPGVSLHVALASAWAQPDARPGAADVIRRALVLCADHELNASTFAVRVVASTGATITAAVLAGLTALSGPRHGGATEHVRDLFTEVTNTGDAAAALRARLDRGERLPGFGHPLYPDGDPRADALLRCLHPEPLVRDVIDIAEQLTGLRPSIDLALVGLERMYMLPRGAALSMFAIGRSVGWIAHALEQRTAGTLIRPRAQFVADPERPTSS